jgi:quercetin dioxygenase-like cupin family protein
VEYLRTVDFEKLAVAPDRAVQSLLDHDSGARNCSVSCVQTPPGGGSPANMHTHVVEQVFYVLSGTMNLEIAGQPYAAHAGTLIVFPAGVPHRNWNDGAEPTIHLAFNAPLPDMNHPFARPIA